MTKRIAIPVENGILCAHFGHCKQFAIIEVEDDKITSVRHLTPPEHVPGLYPRWIAEFGVTDVIAGGMGQHAIDLFNEQNINAFTGAPIASVNVLVNDFTTGKLSLSANYCDHDEHTHSGCTH